MNLTISNISKQYRRSTWALQDFNLELKTGVIGLLGPNGAGKSTLMRMLATITQPTTGTIFWNNINIVKSPDKVRSVLGYLPQDFGIYPNLSGEEFLKYIAAIKGLENGIAKRRIDELLVLVNMLHAAKRPLGSYSGGMKQRIGIAQALLNDPKLLIVDEPTVGLDPEERIRFRNLLSDLSEGRIVILSTHIVSDVEATATEIVIMNKGHKIQQASPEKLLAQLKDNVWQWIIPSEDLPNLKKQYTISSAIRRETGIQIRVVSQISPSPEAERVNPTLEDVYLWAINHDGESK